MEIRLNAQELLVKFEMHPLEVSWKLLTVCVTPKGATIFAWQQGCQRNTSWTQRACNHAEQFFGPEAKCWE